VPKREFGKGAKRSTFSARSPFNLIFPARIRQTTALAASARQNAAYNLYRNRFLCRCAFMRLRRLCLAIFAFLLFLSEPIQIF
jgi:hypothetical protein